MPESIEDIILAQDQRGVSQLRGHVPPDFCAQAAQYILDHPGPALITTGFYILSAASTRPTAPRAPLPSETPWQNWTARLPT